MIWNLLMYHTVVDAMLIGQHTGSVFSTKRFITEEVVLISPLITQVKRIKYRVVLV